MNPSSKYAAANPTSGLSSCASAGGFIASLIEAARRQETLIEALVAAVDSGDETAILHTARDLAANRRRDTPPLARKLGRKKKGSTP